MSIHDDHSRMIDDEIDAVARSLTAASPSAALRSGVRARIAGRSASSHAVRWSLGIAAVAAVILLAIVWPGREAPVATPASREAIAAIVRPPATTPPIEAGPPPRPVVRPAVPDSESPLEVEILELQPLELEPLGVPLLAVEGWDVEPLALQ